MKYTLEESLKKRSNNLAIIQFIAALMVIYNHAYALTSTDKIDIVRFISRDKQTAGMLAVAVFFLSSGILISKSADMRKSDIDFIRKRCLRIFPSLFATVIVCTFVLGPFMTELSLSEYFSNINTYKYLSNCFLVLKHDLPGVFEQNASMSTVNGSLWTLPVEFLCYILCIIIYKLDMNKKGRIITLGGIYIVFSICFFYLKSIIPSLELLYAIVQPAYMFLLGMILYTYKDKIIISNNLFGASVIGFIIFLLLGLDIVAMWVFFPYVICFLSFMKWQSKGKISVLGKYSYGIYLCAFPVQQTIISINGGNMTPLINLILSAVVAIPIGMLLYYFEEIINNSLYKITNNR